jgi:hypothetical protein
MAMPARIVIAVGLVLVLGGSGGCVSNTSGSTTLTADNVNQIKKGVTTRAEVEAIFGPPAEVTMQANGQRALQYYFVESDMHADPQTFIPVVQMFAAKSEGQTTRRSLQIELNANDVVQDYQFNDSTSHEEVGTFGSSSTPVSNPGSNN